MGNSKAILDPSPVGVYEIKKYILLRTMKKIDDIMRKTRRIRKINKKIKKNIYNPFIDDDEKYKNACE